MSTPAESTSEPSGEPTPAPQSSLPEIGAEAARAVLLDASLDEPASLDQVEALKGDPQVLAAAEELAASAAPGGPRWAVVYVLANATGAAPALAPFLDDSDVTIRVMASIGAVGQGERAGFPVLIEALAHDEPLSGFEPPTIVWVVASLTLARHSGLVLGPALDADPVDRASAIERWQEWWVASGGSIRFDPATEEWTAA